MTTFDVKAHKDVTGEGPRWFSQSDEPWFHIATPTPLAGRWIHLRWSAGLLDSVSRPVLRFEFDDGFYDTFLPGAPFGRAAFTVFVPQNVRRVLLSPTNRRGAFGFRLDGLAIRSPLHVRALAFARAPTLAMWAWGANLIARPRDARALLRDALAVQPMSRYAAWRRQGTRPLEPEGIDGPEAAMEVHIPLLRCGTPLDRHVLEGVLSEAGDDGIIGVLQEGVSLEPLTLKQVTAAARVDAQTDVFFGDCEQIVHNNAQPIAHLRSGFDSLLLQDGEMNIGMVFVRVRALKSGHASIRHEEGRLAVRLSPEGTARNLFRCLSRETGPVATPDALKPALNTPRTQAEATIIIPTKNRYSLLKPCVESLLSHTESPYKLVIVDNGTTDADAAQYLDEIGKRANVQVISSPGRFNFSALCNLGARHSTSPVLVFLNNDTEALAGDWLDHVVPLALRPDVGAVGAKLLFDNRRVQHAGCVIGMGGRAGHFEHGMAADDSGFFRRANKVHRVCAVTGALLAVERTKFEAVGGFDAQNLPVDLNDIDLCLRLREAGYENLFQPNCQFLHHESATRGHPRNSDATYAQERRYFSQRWFHHLREDPYFTPVLSLYASDPALG